VGAGTVRTEEFDCGESGLGGGKIMLILPLPAEFNTAKNRLFMSWEFVRDSLVRRPRI
jgi:hypothetical protein